MLLDRVLKKSNVAIGVPVDQLSLLRICKLYGVHTKKLACVFCDPMDYCYNLLPLKVVALNRVIVQRHQQETPFLPHFKDVCIVGWVSDKGVVSQAVDKKLIIQRHKEIVHVLEPAIKRVVIV